MLPRQLRKSSSAASQFFQQLTGASLADNDLVCPFFAPMTIDGQCLIDYDGTTIDRNTLFRS